MVERIKQEQKASFKLRGKLQTKTSNGSFRKIKDSLRSRHRQWLTPWPQQLAESTRRASFPEQSRPSPDRPPSPHLSRLLQASGSNRLHLRKPLLHTTTHLQPLDAGLIQNTKHHFKGLLVRRLLAKIDRKDDDLRISLLDAIHFLAMAWDRVTPTTIANCFAKCGFFKSPAEVSPEPENPESEDWDRLDAGCAADDFCSADDNLATCGARTAAEHRPQQAW
ncbi:centromere protein B, putative [Ixodes scapularis]|uniref:Centromere protein B, putative n=1 Tax=Ixodes scapularis TaxID=6945 RepID=B7PUK0_IXOSC|nr:centromere protein B, putative [Ixodes scapularis]|eukprot:XP_002406195.1 centromere protein B, putative [Ixodes scapularis]